MMIDTKMTSPLVLNAFYYAVACER